MPNTSPFKHVKPDDSAGFLLWKITSLWQAKLVGVLGEFGITQTQYAILASLKWFEPSQEPTTQGLLADHTKIDKMTVSKAIRILEKNGLVKREQSSTDSRSTNVTFTVCGQELIHKAIVAIEKADDEFFSGLTKKQLEMYQQLTLSIIQTND